MICLREFCTNQAYVQQRIITSSQHFQIFDRTSVVHALSPGTEAAFSARLPMWTQKTLCRKWVEKENVISSNKENCPPIGEYKFHYLAIKLYFLSLKHRADTVGVKYFYNKPIKCSMIKQSLLRNIPCTMYIVHRFNE